jgi:2-polyprenyl-6-methoxyphenol hydroxylase-like FAD-dependent oxidoreductase
LKKFIGTQAAVVGAGMAGLVAARALSAHFERVTVLERDELPTTPRHRAGTPQSRHLHALLGGGLAALEELFPNFASELRLAGTVPLRATLDTRIERPGFDPFPQRDLGWEALSLSHPLIEEGFMEFAKSLRTSTIYDAIKSAKRVGGIERFLRTRHDRGGAGSGRIDVLPARGGRPPNAIRKMMSFLVDLDWLVIR